MAAAAAPPVRDQVKFNYSTLWQIAQIDQNPFRRGQRGGTKSVSYDYGDPRGRASSSARVTTTRGWRRCPTPDQAWVDISYGASPGIGDLIKQARAAQQQLARFQRHQRPECQSAARSSSTATSASTILQSPPISSLRSPSTAATPIAGQRAGTATPPSRRLLRRVDRFGRVRRRPGCGMPRKRRSTAAVCRSAYRACRRWWSGSMGTTRWGTEPRMRTRASAPQWNGRDRKHTYDKLQRLIRIAPHQPAPRETDNSNANWRSKGSQKWTLDMLGNWSAMQTEQGGNGDFEMDGSEKEVRTHNAANQLAEANAQRGGGAAWGGGTPPVLPFAYDSAGNMRTQTESNTDWERVYTHDAWNRLVKVERHEIGTSNYQTLQANRYKRSALACDRRFGADRPDGQRRPAPPAVSAKPVLRRVMWYDAGWRLVQEDVFQAALVDGDGPGGDPAEYDDPARPADARATRGGWTAVPDDLRPARDRRPGGPPRLRRRAGGPGHRRRRPRRRRPTSTSPTRRARPWRSWTRAAP